LDYQVYLHANSLYDTPTIGPGQKIFADLVDHVGAQLHCNVDVNADRQVRISGTYAIVADVQTDDWVKRVVIKPQTSFNTDDDSLRLYEAFTLDLAGWDTIVSTVSSETGTSAKNPRSVITATVDVTVSTSTDVESTTMSGTMEVPLRGASYDIVIANPAALSGSLTATQTVVQRSVQDQRKYSLIAMLLAMLVSVGAVILVRRAPTYSRKKDADSALRETLRRKQKKYKDHLVAATQIVQPPSAVTTVTAASLEELLKVADELGKPVLFTDSEGLKERLVYYVLDGSVCYQWRPFPGRRGTRITS